MKSTCNLIQAHNGNLKQTPKKRSAGNLFKFLIAIFILSGMTLLSSCVATLRSSEYDRTPRYSRQSITVIQPERKHDNGNHYGQYKNKKKNKHKD